MSRARPPQLAWRDDRHWLTSDLDETKVVCPDHQALFAPDLPGTIGLVTHVALLLLAISLDAANY